MMSREQVERDVERLKSKRAGSIFPKDFEAGWLYGLLCVLNRAPLFASRADVEKWIRDMEEPCPDCGLQGGKGVWQYQHGKPCPICGWVKK